MGKLLALEVFLDVDLVKALVKAYEPAMRTFYNADRSILCCLDKIAVVEAFGLDGPMSKKIYLEYLNKRFKESTNSFTKGAMKRHIIRDRLEVKDIPKKLTTTMPMEYFKPYFQNTVYGLNMVLGMDSTANAQGGMYIMPLDIQDIHTNAGYDFPTHIIDMIHNEVVVA